MQFWIVCFPRGLGFSFIALVHLAHARVRRISRGTHVIVIVIVIIIVIIIIIVIVIVFSSNKYYSNTTNEKNSPDIKRRIEYQR